MPKKKTKKRTRRSPSSTPQHRNILPSPRRAEVTEEPAPPSEWYGIPAGDEYSRGGAAVNINLSPGSMPAVRIDFGELFAQERRRPIRDGWGFTIELPAVLDLLDHITAGTIDAHELKDALQHAPSLLYGTMRCYEYEDPDALLRYCTHHAGCALCDEHHKWFDAYLDHRDTMWTRLQQPDNYPYTAGRSGIHLTTCHVVARNNPLTYTRPTGDTYTAALRSYSHTVDPCSDREDFEGSNSYPQFEAMTTEQARAWIAERTGPKGGRNYTRCKWCAPTP